MPDSVRVQVPPRTNVYLNVYDLTPINKYFYWFGIGVFHSGLEAHGVEYAFGAHDYPTSGVFEVEPRNTPGFVYRKTILLGSVDLGPREFRNFIERAADEYTGDSYHLIGKNCNHFTNDMCWRLLGKEIPGWVNRLARLGWLVNCLLPESLQVTAMQQEYTPFQGTGQIAGNPPGSSADGDRLLSAPSGDSQDETRERLRDAAQRRIRESNTI